MKKGEACSHTPPIPTPDRAARHPQPFRARNQEGRRSALDLDNAVNRLVLDSPGAARNAGKGGDRDDGGLVSAGSFVVVTATVAF
ncbi:hypothetical protein E2562_010970 [Oryza meyeriana var. granulata]|uniref:Uncharacterized protein n=1 Tax=Oryza meyeriana var. granulata TaxID=110450 RepID=A0A6G1BV46_9ORYZ|nr:hypothetical protein E2562_010970 [Oryza meyeriana var. granulata]